MVDLYQQAAELAQSGDVEECWKVVNRMLNENPNDPRALVTGSFLMRRIGHNPESYHFAKAATNLIPHDAAPWINLGHAASEMWLIDEAEDCYKRALKCQNISEGTIRRNTLLNMSALYIDNGRYEEAFPIAHELLKIDPEDRQGKANLGFCQLATRDWSGWANYRHTLGSEWRPRVTYNNEPEWDGTPDKTVVLYGEQGIGDEISFASMLPDAARACKKVILDCDPRLEGLFRRSFPKISVHGTRMAKTGKWPLEDRTFDASFAMGQIGEYFRTDAKSFPGTPYLLPDPDRVKMWRALFADKPNPVIGIAWRGGVPKSNARNRQLMLHDLLPVFKQLDAHYVSLQYKDATKEISQFRESYPQVDLVQYKFGTLTADYDDTAAMIASMDYVLCIQTAVAHTAGALGIPVTVLVPVASQWRYGTAHESIPWYKSLRVIRQKNHGNWKPEIERAAARIAAHFRQLPARTADSPRDDSLRYGLNSLCANSLADHQENGSHSPS